MLYQVTDWDDAYSNFAHIPDADSILPRFTAAADSFRAANPPQPLGAGRLYVPAGDAKGLAVFIHGGYWMEPYPDLWSHLAAGPFAQGWAVAMPTYQLAPKARIADMVAEVAAAIVDAAGRIDGPIAITGHSAGGHLAARMICDDGVLPDDVFARVSACVPISPIADLRPIMRTQMNTSLQLTVGQARRESPALLTPRMGVPVTCWVGGMERPEFIRQAKLLANVWAGLGAATDCVIDPGRHHMDILDGLTDPDSPLTRTLLAQP